MADALDKTFCRSIKAREGLNNCMIPKAFLEKYDLDNKLTLEAEGGLEWKVEIGEVRGEKCIQKGWRSFATDNSLKVGDTVLFKVLDPSKLLVKVYSSDGYEKQGVKQDATEEEQDHLGDIEQPVEVDIVDSKAKKEEEKAISNAQKPAKKRDRAKVDDKAKGNRKGTFGKRAKSSPSALEAAESFESENPRLVIGMVKSSLDYLHIYREFAEKNLVKKDQDITMVDEDDNEFPVKYIAKRAVISGGWRGYAKNHNIHLSDAIVLEVLSADTLKCHIFRDNGVKEVQAGPSAAEDDVNSDKGSGGDKDKDDEDVQQEVNDDD